MAQNQQQDLYKSTKIELNPLILLRTAVGQACIIREEGVFYMQIDFEMTDEILIASLNGELDHHTGAVIREEIDKTIDAFHSRHLIFNFEKVSFMDSSGIGVIMGRYNKITQLGGKLLITGCNEYIDRILDMSGIYTIAVRMTTLEEAIEKMKTETSEEEVEGSDR